MKFPGYKLAPDESGFSARFIGRSSAARRFIVERAHRLLKTHIERGIISMSRQLDISV